MEHSLIHFEASELLAQASTRGRDSFVGTGELDNKPATIKITSHKLLDNPPRLGRTLDLAFYKQRRITKETVPLREFRITPESIIEVIPTQNGVLIKSSDEAAKEDIAKTIQFHHAENFWEEG